ncbi:AMP-binding protein [Endozoicomonas atrinae]|uniref:AMP-binding protein n=1 Tax=Endozoicomonas atrinae TaxID=1333660 RepID=UPI0008248528|nr:AMP-binding protein [Endozoicomonas atrinae]
MKGVLSVGQWLNQKNVDGQVVLLEKQGICDRGEFLGEVAGLTEQLRSRPEQRWVLVCDDTGLFVRSLLAMILSGKTIFLPANSQPGTLHELQSITDALLTDQWVDDFDGGQISVGRDFFAKVSGGIELDSSAVEQASLVFYTSGSSGQPKPVAKQIAQLEQEIQALETLWGTELNDAVVLACVSHQHIYGVLFRILWPLLSGRAIETTRYEYPEQLIAGIHQHKAVAVIASPAQLDRLPTDLEWHSVQRSVAMVFSSGAPLSASGAGVTDACFGSVPFEVLGSSETGGVAWRQQSSVSDSSSGWQPLPGVQVVIEDGLLKVFSPWLDNPEAGYLMADRATLTGNKFLLQGRADRIAKIEGKRVSLSEMERRLCQSSLVSDAWSVELTGRRMLIGMVVVLSDEGRHLLKEHGRLFLSRNLREELSEFFEAVTLPRKWRFLDWMPVNQQGKRVTSELVNLFEVDEATEEAIHE